MKDFKEERLNSMKQALTNGGGDEPEETEEPETPTSQENTENSQEDGGVQAGNLGGGEDSPYLENEDSNEPNEDPQVTGDEGVLDKVFKGDVNNLQKSYVESQREITKAQQRIRELEGQVENNDLTKNEKLQKLLELAERTEDVESLIESQSSKPEGKSNATPTEDGKFDGIENEFLPNVDKLIESGYIKGDLDQLTDFDKRATILSAQQAYLNDNLASVMKENYRKSVEEVEAERQKQRVVEQLTQTNTDRFEDGFGKAVQQFNLNFAGEHKDLFDEIKEEAKSFRDPSDPRMIRPNAVQLATQQVLTRKGMVNGQSAPQSPTPSKQPEQQEQRQFSTNHSSTPSKRSPDKPLTLEERMSQRRATSASADLSRRKSLYRSRQT